MTRSSVLRETQRQPWVRVSGVLISLILGSAAALFSPLSAQAAGTIEVSADGVTYGPTYPGVLFDGIAKVAPGDTQAEVFYLRNSGPDAGYVRLTLRDVTGDVALLGNLSVAASVPAAPGQSASLASASPCWVLNEGIYLAAGSTVAVTTSLIFDATAGNPTQNVAADFTIGASLTDTAVPLPPTNCGGSATTIPGTVPQPAALSYTGSEVPVMPIAFGAFIAGVGLFLVVAARRRKRTSGDGTLDSSEPRGELH